MIAMLSERLFYLAGVYSLPPSQESLDKFGHLVNKWYDLPWWPFPRTGPRGLEPNFLFCAFISIIVFLYVAEVSTRFFDTPSVQVSSWVYKRLKKMRI